MLKKFRRIVHHYFLPHESNNFRARLLHHRVIVYYIMLLIVFQMIIGLYKGSGGNVLGYATDINIDRVLYYVNQERTSRGLSSLKLNSELDAAATQKATDMFDKNYWAHISPTGTTPWTFITASGYHYVYAGENLAKDFNTSKEVVDAWMNSPSHRENILKPEYTDIGIAVMNGRLTGEDTTLVVEEFGSQSQPQTNNIASNNPLPEPTATPTILPVVSTQTKAENPPPASVVSNKPLILSASVSKSVSLVLAEVLLIVLFLDSLYMWKFKPARISGHSLAHIIFLAALIGAMGATGIGVIL